MKKIVCMFLLITLIVALSPSVMAESEESFEFITIITDGDYTCALHERGNVELLRYSGDASDLTLPDSINGHPLTAIDMFAFADLPFLESITIPDGITYIRGMAFCNCTSLKSVNIGCGVEKIEANPFAFCPSLIQINVSADNPAFEASGQVLFDRCEGELVCYPAGLAATHYDIPQGTKAVGNAAFLGCFTLANVTIPNTLTAIGSYAFTSCTSLTDVAVPDSVLSVGDEAFAYCTTLERASLGSSIIEIGANPFRGSHSLIDIELSPDHETLEIIGPALFYRPEKMLLSYLTGSRLNTHYEIPSGVRVIGTSAFAHCTALESVTIPDTVTKICEKAFYECTSLKEIAVPDGVTEIQAETFYECFSLEYITMPNDLTRIDRRAFYSCTSLAGVTIPDSVIYINDDTFAECENLTLTVGRKSYASRYADEQKLPYIYADSPDKLNE